MRDVKRAVIAFALLAPTGVSAQDPCLAGAQALQRGQAEIARVQYEACVKLRPPSFQILSNLATVYAQLGRFDDAVATFRRALTLNPTDPGLHRNLGLAFMQAGRFAEAGQELSRTAALDPRDLGALEALAWCRWQTHDADGARAAANDALRMAPQSGMANLVLGLQRLANGRPQDAIAPLKLALASTGSAQAHAALGEAFLAANDPRSAIAELSAAVKLNPRLPIHGKLGAAHARLGDQDAAVPEFLEELRRNPDDFDANYYIGRVRRINGETEEAEKYLKTADHQRPGDPMVAYEYAVIAMRRKQYRQAETFVRQVIRTSPNDRGAHVLLSEICFKTGRRAEALREKEIVRRLVDEQQQRLAAGKTGPAYGGSSARERPQP